MVTGPSIAFRVDASLTIGTGHVTRCLTLAKALRQAGHQGVRFVTRALPGHLGARIQAAGFETTLLPKPDAAFIPSPDDPAHAAWAGVSWEEDAHAVAAAVEDRPVDWLVVDHYAFDARWERALAERVSRVFVWDDLADRPHACNLLLDQNLGRTGDAYAGLVPGGTPVLAGPRYAVLRPEFAALRDDALARRHSSRLKRIMVSMGGVDRPNATGAVLDVLSEVSGLDAVSIEVILGSRAPAVDSVRAQAAAMPMRVEVAVDVDDMALRMARADLAIGAVGGTTWERCTLGLPSLLLTIAANQRPAAEALGASGAVVFLGDSSDAGWRARLANWLSDAECVAKLPRMATSAAAICDGGGADRVCTVMRLDTGAQA